MTLELKLYHITEVTNLESMISTGYIFSDNDMIKNNKEYSNIGMKGIKEVRSRKPIPCFQNCFVGDFVPFNFCPRSVMLYIIYQGNHTDFEYKGGQKLIVHLEADLREVYAWLNLHSVKWAFTTGNARANYIHFHTDINELSLLDNNAINSSDFRNQSVKEKKQSEFLIHQRFPIELISTIGVYSEDIRCKVEEIFSNNENPKPSIVVKKDWYY